MRFEHFGINVPDARAMAHWYVKHLGMRAVREQHDPPYTHFLADATGRVVMELYTNPAAGDADYSAQHPLRYHHAFAVDAPMTEKKRLEKAGATTLSVDHPQDGSTLVMMRDPWGVPLQLCKRAKPMA